LGFGRPSGYAIFPETSLNTLPLSRAGAEVWTWLPLRMTRKMFYALPRGTQTGLRRVLGGRFGARQN